MKKLLLNKISAFIIGGIIVGLSVFAFQASAASETPQTVTICIKNSGFVYVVGQGFWAKDCGKRDKLITINTEGVPGPKGDKGDKGDPGDSIDVSELTQRLANLEFNYQEQANNLEMTISNLKERVSNLESELGIIPDNPGPKVLRMFGTSEKESLTSEELLTLNTELSNTRIKKWFQDGNCQFIYYAYPSSWGEAMFFTNGLLNTAWTISEVIGDGWGQSYIVYRSNTIQCGSGISLETK